MTENIIDLVDSQLRRAELAERRLAQGGVVAQPGERPVITISRELGSGGRRVAEEISERLGFSIWDGELVEQMATDARVDEHLIRNFDEHVVSEIEILLRHLAGEQGIGGFQYKRHLTRTLLQIAKIGNAVILGRGANFVLPNALNARVIASHGLRVQNMVRFENLDPKEAGKRIDHSDHSRAEFTRTVWGRDWKDPVYYDLVIRMDEFRIDQAAEILIGALIRRLASNINQEVAT